MCAYRAFAQKHGTINIDLILVALSIEQFMSILTATIDEMKNFFVDIALHSHLDPGWRLVGIVFCLLLLSRVVNV